MHLAGGLLKKLILKYNSRLGKNPLPKIEELAKRFGLKIEKIEESRPGHKVIAIGGSLEKLNEMDQVLVRYASIIRKTA
jgi:hypothetical protein